MKKALVAIDQSDISKSLISYSFRYARQIGIEHLDFIHVMTYKDMTVPGYVDYSAHLDEEKVQQEMERIILEGKADSGVESVPYELIMTGGTPYAEIVEMAKVFGGGIDDSKCLCGAVAGGTMSLSLQGQEDKASELVEEFRAQFKNTCCKGLTARYEWLSKEHIQGCRELTAETAALVARLLEKP